ncbi:MAG: response regulator transcription factor [Gemmatimonadota bacterium]|nr:response regulator transcription factor [Gemmatimonadota bacterium]MDH4349774.1 response regulator transcription factor [Gemmatimonadota bacterium]MDH5195653.1 response regulator transcription factor [Gemmatimonadota bacterium]
MTETGKAPIRVVVADDHAIVREGIRQVLDGTEGISVVGEAANGPEAFERAQTLVPDVVVLDVSMPGESGLEVAKRLKRALPATRVLMLSVYDNTEFVLEAVRAGADGYLLKDSSPSELRAAIRKVTAGESAFSAAAARQLSTALREEEANRERAERVASLTARELDVLQHVVAGQTNKETAAVLGISHRTVETHRENILKKLGVRSVAELTRLAIETGLVDNR